MTNKRPEVHGSSQTVTDPGLLTASERFHSYCVPKPPRPRGFLLKKIPLSEAGNGYNN